jgi:hypothetical protein
MISILSKLEEKGLRNDGIKEDILNGKVQLNIDKVSDGEEEES